MRTIHHGIDLNAYRLQTKKQDYLSFLGRIAPIKGTHLAIEVAKKSGIPLKIAGEVQPIFQDYFDSMIKPHIDGKFIEYVGEADLAAKNELLGNSLAMLFPIQWNEPFGLVMIEAMACGTPVLALPGGAVEEVVRDGISGFVCANSRRNGPARFRACREHSSRRRCGNIASSTSRSDRMVADYVALYQELADEDSPLDKPTIGVADGSA